MIVRDYLFRGQSELVIFVLKDDIGDPILFAGLDEVVVQFKVNNVLQLTKTKTGNEVVAVAGETNQCKVAIEEGESANFPKGLLEIRMTLTAEDADFPDGRKDIVEVAYKNVK